MKQSNRRDSLAAFRAECGHPDETSAWFCSFAMAMKFQPEEDGPIADVSSMDRRIIRVETPSAQAGITAALRRAFEAAASEPCDRDFTELLRRLN